MRIQQHALTGPTRIRAVGAVNAGPEIGQRVNKYRVGVCLEVVERYIEARYRGAHAGYLVLIKRPLILQIMASGVSRRPVPGWIRGGRARHVFGSDRRL